MSYSQPPYPQPQQVMVVRHPPTSGVSVVSLVFGILGVLGGWCLFAIPCVVAVICGHFGLVDTKGGRKSGRGLAIAGLVLGYLFVGPVLVVTAMGGVGAVFGDSTPTPTPTP